MNALCLTAIGVGIAIICAGIWIALCWIQDTVARARIAHRLREIAEDTHWSDADPRCADVMNVSHQGTKYL